MEHADSGGGISLLWMCSRRAGSGIVHQEFHSKKFAKEGRGVKRCNGPGHDLFCDQFMGCAGVREGVFCI
nr:hypothetical protein [Helicobacter heilmannii]